MEERVYTASDGDARDGKPTLVLDAETQHRDDQVTLNEISAKLDVLLQANGISLGE